MSPAPVAAPGGEGQAGENKQAAQAFISFLGSPEGKEVLQKYGFLTP